MTKRIILSLLTIVFAIVLAACAKDPGYTDRTVKVFSCGEEAGELSLRFYDRTPNIPYMGMNQYAQSLGRPPFRFHESGEGTWELESWNGAKLICDTREDRISVPDWNAFFALPMPLEDRTLGLKDTNVHFAKIVDVSYEGEAEPVTIDFAGYGIKLYCDESDLYLPVSTLSNLMTDIATNHILYNGENLYEERLSLTGDLIDGLFESDVIQAQIRGEDRPEDIIKQCYADLCLTFDFFFGHPGKAVLDEALADQGLDQALEGLGEDGQAIKEGLLSPSLADYLDAMTKLFFGYLSDGHTLFYGIGSMLSDPAVLSDAAFAEKLQTSYMEKMMSDPVALRQLRDMLIPVQREKSWGEDSYREYGSTAIIRLDNFSPDEAAWDSYYRDAGEFPQDCLGIVATGLKRASENPEIENVIIDLSANEGGSPDVMMAILAMTTGKDQLSGWNRITDQAMTVTFEIDANFDGVYDEKDREVRYDFNYGALVTRHAFSCGNLFPIIFQEDGAVLIGEPSSGGSCCVQVGSDAEGLYYLMSSAQWQLCDSRGVSVEGGCVIDVPIETGTMPITELTDDAVAEYIASLIGEDAEIPAYQDYYDDARLDEIMNDWFGAQAQLDQAE